MIPLGYTFPTSGARALLIAPSGPDSYTVLVDYGGEWVTGTIYVHQLPEPQGWRNGHYFPQRDGYIEAALRDFRERANVQLPVGVLLRLLHDSEEKADG